jgi:nucleoside-diphosphate-sugar epimerase
VDDRSAIGLLGARGLVGECLTSLLVKEGHEVIVFSRNSAECKNEKGVTWLQIDQHQYAKNFSQDLSQQHPQQYPQKPQKVPLQHPQQSKHPLHQSNISNWLCVAPIWILPDYFNMLEAYGVRRIIALSSTSRFTKDDSSDPEDQATAHRLADAEQRVEAWAQACGVEWVVLRPTLIYGYGRDKNIAEIIRVIRRFGFFPLFGKAQGLRQPIHAQDVAAACVAALRTKKVANRAYNISGAETLTYRDMVARIFHALKQPVRLFTVPLLVFRMAVAMLRCLPRYRKWTPAMAERMNRDLVFDHSDATRDFGFKPRSFILTEKDIST